jgi:hypothetical protein
VKSFGASSGTFSTSHVSPVDHTRQGATSIEIIEAPFAAKKSPLAVESLLFLSKSEVDFCSLSWLTLSRTDEINAVAVALVDAVNEHHDSQPFANIAFGANPDREFLWSRGNRKERFDNAVTVCSGDLFESCALRPKYLTRNIA